MYACDPEWWDVHIDHVRANYTGECFTQYTNAEEKARAEGRGLTALEGKGHAGLGRDCIHHNHNSGAQAINLAYLMGASRIVLLGYDMQWTGGKKHFFGDHPGSLSRGCPLTFVRHFDKLASDLQCEKVEVINCTRETALNQFPRASLSSTLT